MVCTHISNFKHQTGPFNPHESDCRTNSSKLSTRSEMKTLARYMNRTQTRIRIGGRVRWRTFGHAINPLLILFRYIALLCKIDTRIQNDGFLLECTRDGQETTSNGSSTSTRANGASIVILHSSRSQQETSVFGGDPLHCFMVSKGISTCFNFLVFYIRISSMPSSVLFTPISTSPELFQSHFFLQYFIRYTKPRRTGTSIRGPTVAARA